MKSTGLECFKMLLKSLNAVAFGLTLFCFCTICRLCIFDCCSETGLPSVIQFCLYRIVFFTVWIFFMSSPRVCLQLLLILSAKWRFSFQGMDKIIPFRLCSIFGRAVLPCWSDMPVPVVAFSACQKCSFCILKRAGTLWSFDTAQQGREGQWAQVPNVQRQLRLWKINLLCLS